MCSPLGNCTINSLMKVATFLLEITSHSHSFTPSTSSGTFTFISSFTLVWQAKRQCSFCCLREKKTFSVGRISPPPSMTCARHWPHLPPPPQADDKKMPPPCKAPSKVPPIGVSTSFSPFTVNLTFPDGTNFALANNNAPTRIIVTTRNTTALAMIVSPPDINKVISFLSYL